MSMTTTSTSTIHPNHNDPRVSLSSSSASTLCASTDPSPYFRPSRTLNINAQGIRAIRPPLPDSQFEITVTHPDGSEAYTSTRDRRWSGNCVLSHPKLGDLLRTEYFFGPNRDPVLHLLQTSDVLPEEPSIKLSGRWTSRSIGFTLPSGAEFEWSYAKERRGDGQKVKLIVLQAVGGAKGGDGKEKEVPSHSCRIAQLVRCDETRTPGTSRCSAGNGGELQIDEEALRVCELDEAILIATCLVNLKREGDRRRMIQCAAMAGGGAGG